MTETSVIQMSADAHFAEMERLRRLSLDMFAAGLFVAMSPEQQEVYLAGFDRAWSLATTGIMRSGNCRFEAHHG